METDEDNIVGTTGAGTKFGASFGGSLTPGLAFYADKLYQIIKI